MAKIKKKKIVLVTSRVFWPADSGRKVSLYHYCKGLHEQLGYDVYIYTFLEGGQSATDALPFPSFIEDVKVASPLSSITKIKNLAIAVFNSHMPFQCALYRNKENRMAIRSYCKDLKPDVVMIDMIRFAPYINALDGLCCPVVLDYDDLLSKRYSRQIGETSGNPLGNYASQATGIVSRLMTNCAARNAILSLESKRIEEAEAWYAKRADAILFVSPKEACELDKKLGTNKCFNATVGVELTDVSISSTEKEYDLGFVGNLNTAANQASLDYICYEILPLLPGLRLRIIGVCPDEVKNRFSSFDQVSFSGRVDSIGVELLKCKVMLAPFVYGSGIKTKVLEAMGIGVPVVTNDLGVEGMSCKPNSEFELGNSPIEIAHCCKTLLANENRRREIALAGKDYVRKNHDWRISIENLGRCLDYAEKSKSPNSCGEGIQ